MDTIEFLETVASMKYEGEEDEEDGRVQMSVDDAIETLSWLIVEARGILDQDSEARKLEATFDPLRASAANVSQVLAVARQRRQAGAVAHHLVGAALALLHEESPVENLAYSTAGEPLDRPGDFCIGDTAFHVTVAPTPSHYEKCNRNLENGLRAYLLVPDDSVTGARQNASLAAPGRITVGSIESFVGQNVEELSEFSTDRVRAGFRRLLETYNQRVDAVETDKSLLIDIPGTLHK